MSEIKNQYDKTYIGYGKLNVGVLPETSSEDINDIFFWSHVRVLRSQAKHIPLKPQKKLTVQEWVCLKRNLEIIAYQARYALAYLEKM